MIITKVEGTSAQGKSTEICNLLCSLRDAVIADRSKNGNLNFFVSISTVGNIFHLYEEWDTIESYSAYLTSQYHQNITAKVKPLFVELPVVKVYRTKDEEFPPSSIVVATAILTFPESKVQEMSEDLTDLMDDIRENSVYIGNRDYCVSIDCTNRSVFYVYEEWKKMSDLVAYEDDELHAKIIDGKVRPSLAISPIVSIYEVCLNN